MSTPGQRFDRAFGTAPYNPSSRALNPLDVVIAPGWNVRDVSYLRGNVDKAEISHEERKSVINISDLIAE